MDVILSVFLYFTCFFLCAWMMKRIPGMQRPKELAELTPIYSFSNRRKGIRIILFAIISILPLVLLAALRGEAVGVDTVEYISRYKEAHTKSLSELLASNEEDFLYKILVFVTNRISGDPFFFLASLQFLCLIPIVWLSLRHSEEIDPWAILLIFCFWHYNDSLNGTRQIISVDWLLLAYDYLSRDKKLKAFVLFLIALGFHSSALLLGMALLVIHIVIHKVTSTLKKGIVLASVIIVLVFGQNLFILLVDAGVLPSRYYTYINTFIYRNTYAKTSWISVGAGGVFEVLIRLVLLCITVMTVPSYKRDRQFQIYCLMFFVGIIVYAAGLAVYHTSYFVRLSICFDMFGLLIIPKLDKQSKFKLCVGNKRIKVYTVGVSMIYWIIHILLLKQSGSIPYVFR